MTEPLRLILNDRELESKLPPGTTTLDFIRGNQRLVGTKIGCREGDCGACTVLVGDFEDGELRYRTMTSCLMPLGNAHGKHLVTVEGLNMSKLSPVQQAIVDEGGTQCGFCTPGFVVSLTGFCLSQAPTTETEAIAAMDGNICRCTGYKSLGRAASHVCQQLQVANAKQRLAPLVEAGFLPPYFRDMETRLRQLQTKLREKQPAPTPALPLGGGTDLLVQKPESIAESSVRLLYDQTHLRGIRMVDGLCHIGGATPTEDLRQSQLLLKMFPQWRHYMDLISSTPIRHMATVGGNFVNASPIGDLSICFLALDAQLVLTGPSGSRNLPLSDLFLDYKVLAKADDEIIASLSFKPPSSAFHFEKVCKRTYLDIASVNSAACLNFEEGHVTHARFSAGGVAPIPKYLSQMSAFLIGKRLDQETLLKALEVMAQEISPISDVRGTADYKRLLLRQQMKSHFLQLAPTIFSLEALV